MVAPPSTLPIEIAIDRRRARAPQVYEALRDAILDLRLKPGTHVSENSICRQSKVSRTPVREALIRLAQDELISVFPQQGSVVAPIRLKKVIEACFVREALEVSILRLAAAVWTSEDSAIVDAILDRQQRHAADGDYRAFFREDESFHYNFARVAGLEDISAIIADSITHLVRIRRLADPTEGHMERAISEHREVLECLRRGDTESAVAALTQHLSRVVQTMMRLSNRFPEFFGDLGGQAETIPAAMRRHLSRVAATAVAAPPSARRRAVRRRTA